MLISKIELAVGTTHWNRNKLKINHLLILELYTNIKESTKNKGKNKIKNKGTHYPKEKNSRRINQKPIKVFQ